MPEKQTNALCFKKGRLLLCSREKSKVHALRSLIHNYFDSQRNKVIEEKQKLHDLIKSSFFPRVAYEITLK